MTALPPSPVTSVRGIRVLVVDDDEPSLKLLRAVFESEGAVVSVARSAEEALELVRADVPAIAVIDLVLPRMSGFWLAERLRASEATGDVVLVAVSAINGLETEANVSRAGFAGFQRKPLDPLTFCRFVDSLRKGKSP